MYASSPLLPTNYPKLLPLIPAHTYITGGIIPGSGIQAGFAGPCPEPARAAARCGPGSEGSSEGSVGEGSAFARTPMLLAGFVFFRAAGQRVLVLPACRL